MCDVVVGGKNRDFYQTLSALKLNGDSIIQIEVRISFFFWNIWISNDFLKNQISLKKFEFYS